jgi:hypothetical protein
MAVAERHQGKDHVGVYDIGLGYQLLRVNLPLSSPSTELRDSTSRYKRPISKAWSGRRVTTILRHPIPPYP